MKNVSTLFFCFAMLLGLQTTSLAQCNVPSTITQTGNPGELLIEFDFTAVPNPADFICDAYFYNTIDGMPAYVNGITQSNNPVLLTLPTNGDYTGFLTSIDTVSGCSDSTYISSLIISGIPEDCNTYFEAVQIGQEEVTFSAYNFYPGISTSPNFAWDFGDGTTGSGNPITHLFPAGLSANYTVTLTVTDANCDGAYNMPVSINDPCTIPVTITPTSNPGEIEIEYDFSGVPNPTDFDCYITLYDALTGNTVANAVVTSLTNPYLLTLTTNGDYYAQSYSEDLVNLCYDSLSVGTFTISNLPEDCNVSITSTSSSTTDFTFTASIGFSGVSPTPTYTWDFGDGTTGTGNPINHVYPSVSTTSYIVTLNVTDANCVGSFTTVIYAGAPNSCSTSTYVIPDTQPFPSATNNFAAYGSFGSGASTFWDFGDGNTSNSNPVNHTYNTSSGANTFQALFIVNDSVCTDSIYVMVYTGPNAQCESDFTLVQDLLNPGVYNGYNYSVSNGTTSYFWDFGNGDTSTDQFPTYTYSSVGLYTICLTISSDAGCVDTLCMDIDILVKSGTTINIMDPAQNLSIASQTSASTFAVYPNPSTGNFTLAIESEQDEVYLVQLHDITGKVIYSENYPVSKGLNNLNVDLENSTAGIYFLNLNGETVSKIVLE